MSLQSEIVAALAGIAEGRLFPQIAEQEAPLPLVVYRVTSREPVTRLDGSGALVRYTVIFECWAETYATAMALADQVRAGIGASPLTSFEESSSGEDYEPVTDAYVEPVTFGFWHNQQET